MFKDYLLSLRKDVILNILENEDLHKHYPVNINFIELFEDDPVLGNSILTDPEVTLKKCDSILIDVQQELIGSYEGEAVVITKQNVHTRIYGLPACPELHKIIFPSNEDLGTFLQITGTITRISAMKMLEYKREYMCTKCKHKMMVNADYEQKYVIIPPKRCTNPEFCKGTNLKVNSSLDSSYCRDYQEFKMQEQVSKLEVSTMPSSLWVTLEDDLVDQCKPGDSITICGIIKRRWKTPVVGKPLEVELVVKANHIEVNNDSSSTTLITSEIQDKFSQFWEKYKTLPLYGRDLIIRSFCPQIYGMYVVKLAIATVLAGGSTFERDQNTGTRVRTEPHLLLVGDPGMGKSQLLRYASKVIPRSVLTTGVGSTSAGLTVSAVMEDGEWHLEGGALVLADGGICCIDEFNSMKEHDRTSIHEAMEQQTISVAKASIVSKLSTRCSILAATNSKVSLDSDESLTIKVALASPLLSRFDLILFLKDSMDNDWDEKVCNYILRGHKRKSKFLDNKYNMWSLEMLQAYFIIIKKLNPILTNTSKIILSTYYQLQRKMESRDKSRTTVRLLDSLVRLSQAHARLMCHQEVETVDAIMAISLVDVSMQGSSSKISEMFDPHSDFPDDPMGNYEKLVQIILQELQLDSILEEEMKLLKAYENGEVISTSRKNIMDIKLTEVNSKLNTKATDSLKGKCSKINQEKSSESQLHCSLIQRNNLNELIEEMNKHNDLTVENSKDSATILKKNQNSNASNSNEYNEMKCNKTNERNHKEIIRNSTIQSNNKFITGTNKNEEMQKGNIHKQSNSIDSNTNIVEDSNKRKCIIQGKKSPNATNDEPSDKRQRIGETSDINLINLIPSVINSQEIEDAFKYIADNSEIRLGGVENKRKFKTNLSNKVSFAKSDSGNFSLDSQNVFECLDDEFDDSELDI